MPSPTADFTVPVRAVPASVTPRCSGYGDEVREPAVRVDGHRDRRRLRPRARGPRSPVAAMRSAYADRARDELVGERRSPASSTAGSSEPAFTPTRIGMPASPAASTTASHAVPCADVAGVDAQLGGAEADGLDREAVVEVDVGDDRQRRPGDDLARSRRSASACGIATRTISQPASARRPICASVAAGVARVGVRHRLDGDGRAAADGHVARP